MSERKEEYHFKPAVVQIKSLDQVMFDAYLEQEFKLGQEAAQAEVVQLRKWLYYLVERVPIDADPKLTEITQYIQPFAKRGDFKSES